MGRQSHKAIERILKIGSMTAPEAKAFLLSEKRAEPEEGSAGSTATSELSSIINAARKRGCAEHGHEIKWLIELPMTDDEWKRFNELTGWPSRKQ